MLRARTRTRLTRTKKIQENCYTIAQHGCQGVGMSASCPPSGHRSPASLTGCRLPAPPRSSTPTEENLLRLLDLLSDQLPQLLLTQYDGSGRVALRRYVSCPCVCYTCLQGGKHHSRREGGLGRLGRAGRAGYVLPPEQAPRLIQAAPRKRSHLSRFLHPRMLTHPKYIFIAKAESKALCLGKVGYSKPFLPGTQVTRIFALRSGCPRQDQQVLAQTHRGGSCRVVPQP